MLLPKTKIIRQRIGLRPKVLPLNADDVLPAREHIASYWSQLTRFNPNDDDSLLGLPKPYLVPAYELGHEFDFNELYYWDSYFMVQGLLDDQHKELVMGVLEDLFSLFERFQIIPNASRTYLTGRSQPPLLTSFIMDVYRAYKPSKKWLAKAMELAEAEYQTVWMGTTKPNARQVYQGLSRYYDINYLNDLAETESGWDLSPRFNRHCLDYLPIDLNSLLYKYEMDFAEAAKILGKNTVNRQWLEIAAKRKASIDKLMWGELRNFYYDYNYVKKRRGTVDSLAGYFTMWTGLADDNQAKRLVRALPRFEHKGGLSTTNGIQFSQLTPGGMPLQWAYPNGWAPLHFVVVAGLQRYGYQTEARRIAQKWLRTNLNWFNKHGVFLEKYNVVQPGKPPAKGLYPSQIGFGWTNAVFERFCQEFIDHE
jgi:alpha,alpha-trehalase